MLPTGVGKTWVGITVACKQIINGRIESVLVVTPTTVLIEQWKNQVIKFYGEDMLQFFNFSCIQSAHKNASYADLLIIDEIHTSLSPIYSKVFENVLYKQILGLTATIPEKGVATKILDKYCPVIFTYSVNDAAENQIVADCQMYNLEVTLSKSDRAKYKLFDGNYNRALLTIGMLKRYFPHLKDSSIFDIAREYAKLDTKSQESEEAQNLVKASKAYWSAMTLRKWVCYEAQSKIEAVLDLIKKFPLKKWILFNKSIKFAELLHERIPGSGLYHSNMKSNDRAKIIRKFADGEIHILVCVDALNAGLDIPDADAAICISGVSTELVAVQQRGRITRKDGHKIAKFINLYCKDTVEKGWVEKKTKAFNGVV